MFHKKEYFQKGGRNMGKDVKKTKEHFPAKLVTFFKDYEKEKTQTI